MLKIYHRQITIQALKESFSPQALEIVVRANLGQDHWLRGQVGHPEYHFDQNTFAKSRAYLERNRAMVYSALKDGSILQARMAFGRLTHAAQDFYAHSNYITRWLAKFPEGQWPSPSAVDAFDDSLMMEPDLRSGKIYWPVEPLTWIPGLGRLLIPLIPRDSHAWMNLDSPAQGPAFAYAFTAAVKRTRDEFELTTAELPAELTQVFCLQDPS
jgi:hypothetical protein